MGQAQMPPDKIIHERPGHDFCANSSTLAENIETI